MPVTKKTIVVEDVFEELFSYLPKMSFNENGTEYSVVFGYGDEVDLNAFLANREVSNSYPLIWMLYPQSENHEKNKVVLDGVVFVLAVLTNNSMENKERLKLTFGKILMPLLDNMKHCFVSANIVSLGNENQLLNVIKYPNYSKTDSREETKTIDIWDALKVTVDLEIIETCLRPIKF